MSHEIVAYTDGACSGNPGPGGWGVWLRAGNHEKELCGGEKHTTNQRMELQAAIEALKALKQPSSITIVTDSKYVLNGITDWIHGWKKKGWKNSKKEPVANRELWEALDALNQKHDVDWQWVKGHSGDEGNDKADELARQGIPS
ncbi:MAG: ribonuclease HI [Zetaproteobacteria bacterium]|nr:MAG: ribonuclease HI [Zetaproteobacteria bacterium]